MIGTILAALTSPLPTLGPLQSFGPTLTPDNPLSHPHDLAEGFGAVAISLGAPAGLVVAGVLFFKLVFKPMHDAGRW